MPSRRTTTSTITGDLRACDDLRSASDLFACTDLLSGNNHQDVLIGGLGSDSLYGRDHDDILIGGVTEYDANAQAMLAILAEWTQPTPIDERIGNLEDGGGANGSYVLARYSLASPGGTVYDDGEEDELEGGAAGDWFLDFTSDLVHDRSSLDR